ncbi:multicopper oxidase [Aulographum hederae CBS 113979]|uniref:Multicopper oxidase n=1 Tax=Aulographum hederae CBS 113979 TaxID=1176131 RepID=A0A6G1HFN2_9PEZI|nr:multicopper oxidase [Aulographum hederae CBS 113979]
MIVTRKKVSAYKLATHDNASFTPNEVLRVSAKNITAFCQERWSVVVNGTLPGPEIRIPEGKTTWVRVYNDMPDHNLTIHWHGIAQSTAPFSDGSPLASQWPIPPLHFFDYELAPSPGSAGSYFYHSHVGLQANTASGALIVEHPISANSTATESKGRPFDYDEDVTVMLSDWFNTTDAYMEQGLGLGPYRWIGEVQTVLVNGRGRATNSSAPVTEECGLASIDVEPGKTYRLRFIMATGLSFVSLGIEEHGFSIIEADGMYTQPYETDFLQLGSGQRYSVLLKTKSLEELESANGTTKGEFFLQTTTLARPIVTTSFAVLRYLLPGSSSTTTTNSTASICPLLPPHPPPIFLPPMTYGYLDYLLSPFSPTLNSTLLPPTPARTIYLNISLTTSPYLLWTLNNATPWFEAFPSSANSSYLQSTNSTPQNFSYPVVHETPYLVALYQGDEKYIPDKEVAASENGYDDRVGAFTLPKGEVVDIVVQSNGYGANNQGDVHPLHLHGAHFWDLGSGNGTWNKEAHDALLEEKMGGEDGWNPMKRDTTMLYRSPVRNNTFGEGTNWRRWRVRAGEPGVWLLHCHTIAHLIVGMQSVWVVGDYNDIVKVDNVTAAEGYLTYGGDAYGNAERDPKVVEWND